MPDPARAPLPRADLPQVPVAAPPPFRLPGEHFVAALCWLLVAAALLPAVAGRLAEGRLFEPAVFALVHVVVLGVIASAIFGALNQFVPGGLEVPLKSVALGHAGFWLLQAAVAALVAGFWRWNGALQAAGWTLAFLAVGAAGINVLPARRRSKHGKLVGTYLSVAHSCLGAGMAIGLARIGETLGWWHLDRLGLLAVHLQLGAVGFGTLTAVGVGSRMLPTFLLAQGDDRRWLERLLLLATVALSILLAGALGGWPLVTRSGGALLVLTGAATVALGRRWFGRRRRALDPSLRHVAAAFTGLAGATAWGAALVAAPEELRWWAAYAVAVVLGWLVMLVAGVMAKLVAHLSYIHLFRSLPGFARVGNPNLLLRGDWLTVSGALLFLGAAGLSAAIGFGRPGWATGAAWAWSAGAVLTVANYVRMVVLGLRPGPGPAPKPSQG